MLSFILTKNNLAEVELYIEFVSWEASSVYTCKYLIKPAANGQA